LIQPPRGHTRPRSASCAGSAGVVARRTKSTMTMDVKCAHRPDLGQDEIGDGALSFRFRNTGRSKVIGGIAGNGLDRRDPPARSTRCPFPPDAAFDLWALTVTLVSLGPRPDRPGASLASSASRDGSSRRAIPVHFHGQSGYAMPARLRGQPATR